MKYVKWIFVVLYLCSLTAFIEKDVTTRGLNVGDLAPDFKLEKAGNADVSSLSDLRGQYVLVSFWASYDAPSRMNNALMDYSLSKEGEKVKMVSVSFDELTSVFDESVLRDGLEPSHCYVETSGEASDVYQKYRLQKGFKNFLLDRSGVIIAKNVAANELANYLN
jgi:peroxiredoxin